MTKHGKIIFGGLRQLARELEKAEWQGAKYTIVLDENTFQHCLPPLIMQVPALQEAAFVEVPCGEEGKNLEVAAQVWQTLLEAEADRNAVVVNLGGGSICDLGGFVAAGYKRGIRHINIPTTLLAMVDAAIGGKTALDFGGVKNSIGFFHDPVLTCTDHVFCNTLTAEQVLCGKMEMVKTAAVTDPDLYASLLSNSNVAKSQLVQVARIKQRVVKADPYDHGIRHILNFGHTFGHALEPFGMPHGLAVGVGMLAEMYLSVKKLGLSEAVYETYSQWVRSCIGVPKFTLRDVELRLPYMRQDKKNAAVGMRCVLLRAIGEPVIDVTISDNEVRDAFLHL